MVAMQYSTVGGRHKAPGHVFCRQHRWLGSECVCLTANKDAAGADNLVSTRDVLNFEQRFVANGFRKFRCGYQIISANSAVWGEGEKEPRREMAMRLRMVGKCLVL